MWGKHSYHVRYKDNSGNDWSWLMEGLVVACGSEVVDDVDEADGSADLYSKEPEVLRVTEMLLFVYDSSSSLHTMLKLDLRQSLAASNFSSSTRM